MKNIKINATNKYKLSLNIYDCKKPKAIIQVIHGMEEHQERYSEFASILSKNGYLVITSDMRGHGKEASELGFFKEKNGHQQLVDDQITIRNYIETNYNGTPVILFGHSMGTIISRV